MKKMHYGWAVLVSCCALVLGIGLINNVIGRFFVPVTKEFGFKLGDFTLYYAIRGVFLVASTPLLSKWMAKFDIRLLTSGCFIVQILCLALMSTFSEVWQWYIAGAVMGIFSPPIYFQMPPIILSNWFEKKRGFVIGIAIAFSGIGGAIMNPIIASIILSHGWRFAYIANAIIAGVVVLPFLIFVIRAKPSDMGLKPYGYEEQKDQPSQEGSVSAAAATPKNRGVSKEDAVRSASFVFMAILFAALGFFSGYPQHLTSYGISIGVSATLASFLLSLAMVGNATSKVALGYLNDKFGGKAMLSISFVIGLTSLVLLLIGGRFLPPLLVGALLAGCLYSVSSVASPLFAQTVFGTRDFAKIFILLSLGQNIFVSFGPTLVGYMFDATGGYSRPYMFGIIITVAAACLAYLSVKSSKKLIWR